ncbi:uncharacterized protein YqfA (UPF0365 family) [Sinorhizobium fredii]|uniref:hypothetical protein n=1 Tax=Rhizobium fredii TaxID=380 RepID=UPI003512EBF4
MAVNKIDTEEKYMENGVPRDVSVPYLTVVDAEWLAYDVALELSNQIYRLREAGKYVPQHVLDNLEKAKKTCLDLRTAQGGGHYSTARRDRFLDQMQQIEQIGIREFARLSRAANCSSKGA